MRFSIVLALAGVASATLVDRQNVPNCALQCIANANLGGCSATDNNCLCKSQTFISSTTTCIEAQCTSASDLQAALAFAQATCAAVGVTLTAPSGVPTGTGASSTGTGTGASTTTGASSTTGTSTGTSTTGTAPAATSTGAAKANSVPAFAIAALGLAAFAL